MAEIPVPVPVVGTRTHTSWAHILRIETNTWVGLPALPKPPSAQRHLSQLHYRYPPGYASMWFGESLSPPHVPTWLPPLDLPLVCFDDPAPPRYLPGYDSV
jgi:hypothetical protein